MTWLEEHTGEDYQTLRRHYGKWVGGAQSELRKFEEVAPELFGTGANCAERNRKLGTKGGKAR